MDDFNAHWRSSANEAVPYSEDIPECLSVFPELIDGATGQGNATKVNITIVLNDNNSTMSVSDNGKGISNTRRLLTWASKESIDLTHRYGHGSKKCLTKWSKDYTTANWFIRYRTCDKRGKSSSLFTYTSPFKGLDTHEEEDAENENILMPSGTEWHIDFDKSILKDYKSAPNLLKILKEIIRTRYSSKYLSKTEFIITITEGDTIITESSKDTTKNWKTFEECLKDEVVEGNAKITYNEIHPFISDTTMRYTQYSLSKISGKQKFNLKNEFPTYGHKNMNCARLHIALDGRTIEIPHIWKFMRDRDGPHNDYNGIFGIIDFIGLNGKWDNMPTPCTTKVSYVCECTNYIQMKNMLYEIHDKIKSEPKSSIVLKSELSDKSIILEKIESNPKIKLYKSKPIVAPTTVPVPVPVPVSTHTHTLIPTPTPTVIPLIPLSDSVKLIEEKSKRKLTPKTVRTDVWNKYIGKTIAQHACLCCKNKLILNTSFECGHIVACSKGGSTSIDNLRPICSECNRSMGTKNMIDFIIEHKYYIGSGIS